jgi:hypothetical protein
MMANDFGFYCANPFELPRRFESPGVLPSLGDILETMKWRRGTGEIDSTILTEVVESSVSDASFASILFGDHHLERRRVAAAMVGGVVTATLSAPPVIPVTSAVAGEPQLKT